MDDNDLSPQERAERDAHLVTSSDQLMRRAAGRPDPEEGHDVGEYLREHYPVPEAGPDEREALKAEIKAELLKELRDA